MFFFLMNVHFLSILIIPWLSKNLTKYKGYIFSVIGRNSIVVVKIRQIYSQHDDKNHYQKSSSFSPKVSEYECLFFNRFYRQIVIEEICYFSNFAQESWKTLFFVNSKSELWTTNESLFLLASKKKSNVKVKSDWITWSAKCNNNPKTI